MAAGSPEIAVTAMVHEWDVPFLEGLAQLRAVIYEARCHSCFLRFLVALPFARTRPVAYPSQVGGDGRGPGRGTRAWGKVGSDRRMGGSLGSREPASTWLTNGEAARPEAPIGTNDTLPPLLTISLRRKEGMPADLDSTSVD